MFGVFEEHDGKEGQTCRTVTRLAENIALSYVYTKSSARLKEDAVLEMRGQTTFAMPPYEKNKCLTCWEQKQLHAFAHEIWNEPYMIYGVHKEIGTR